MTNEPTTTKKVHKRGYAARLVGGLLMVLGAAISAGAGSFTVFAALLFFAGLITLVVGISQRKTEEP